MTAPVDDLVAPFEAHRRLLFTVAYELLGAVEDAEDAVQDAWLRWSAADRGDVRNPRAYLVQVVTRVALNRLRSQRARRESYVGPWLPEPLLTAADPVAGPPVAPEGAEHVELAESVSLAMLVVLESLSPAERAVFVLREVFALSFGEIAEALGRTEAAVRQLAHRAREHVQARRPRFAAEPAVHLDVTRRFIEACADGRLAELLDVLAPDVVLTSDGGGVVRAARRPIVGAPEVARFLIGVVAKAPDGTTVEWAQVNGAPALLARLDGRVSLCLQLVISEEGIGQVLVVANPAKLAALDEVRALTVG